MSEDKGENSPKDCMECKHAPCHFQRHGWKQDPRTSSALDKFCQWDYFVKQMSGKRPDYRIKLDVEEAKKRGLLRILEG